MRNYEIIYLYLTQKKIFESRCSMDFANDLDLINNISVSIEQKANSTNFCPSTSAVSTGATRYL